VEINWNPISYLGPFPINWYGLTMALGFIVGGYLTWRWAPKFNVPREKIFFSVLRFFIFFVRGSVEPVALGLKNAQLTAIAILMVAVPLLISTLSANRRNTQRA